MATQKPISTISYNSEAFLVEKLEGWYKAHIIQAYQYICHKGENGDKDHIHVRIEPNKKIDPMNFIDELKEYQIGKEKPLGCRPFRPSKEEDWILYGVHDEEYLAQKYGGGEKGEKIPYKWQDVKANEGYDVETMFIRAKSALAHTSSNMAKRLASGESPLTLALEGENVFQLNAVTRMLYKTDYDRMQAAYAELSAKYEDLLHKYNTLTSAVENKGLALVLNKQGKPSLE